ncbi:DUF1648 domain-containing protein [Streptomyces flavofungini]|uniref:DUF1648 domain-containing protein n=1 Tax=Streptomyces flavofungini TaxID=68200 RepID=UPI0034DF655C
MTAIRRSGLTAIPFAAATATFVGLFLTRYDRLPERIATHFTGDGGADGFTDRTTALWTGGGLLVGLGLLFTLLAAATKDAAKARVTAAIGTGTAVTLGYPLILTVFVNTDIEDPATAHLPMWHIAVLLLTALATGALTWWLMSRAASSSATPTVSALPLAEGEVAAWSRTMTSPAVLLAAGAVTVGGLVAAVSFGSLVAGLPPFLLGLLCAPFGGVRVTVDRRGVTVASTLLPRPRLTLPLDKVTSAGSVQIQALGDFGGWGYRIRPNRRGVVLRSGEALAVSTAGGREYVITVDDSTTAAALLNGLANRPAAGA